MEMSRSAPAGKPFRATVAESAHFTGRDLAHLLRQLPRPDEDYLALIEALGREQPALSAPPQPR